MIDPDSGRFTVGVFQNVAWAEKGLSALKQAGLPAEALTIVAKDAPDVAALIEPRWCAGTSDVAGAAP
jgi:hypothetical protein